MVGSKDPFCKGSLCCIIGCKIHGPDARFLGKKRQRCAQCNVIAVTKRRRKLKSMAVAYKGGACERCAYSKCVEAFDFHHRDPAQKDFAVSAEGVTRSWEKLRIEIDKCALLCANCHRELHAEENK